MTTGNSTVTDFRIGSCSGVRAPRILPSLERSNAANNGCVVSALSPVATVNADAFDHTPISGWAFVRRQCQYPAIARRTRRPTRSTTMPIDRHSGCGAADVALPQSMPDGASLTAFQSGSQTTPYGNARIKCQCTEREHAAITFDPRLETTGGRGLAAGLKGGERCTRRALTEAMHVSGAAPGMTVDWA